MNAEIASAALELASEGLRVFPITANSKAPPIRKWKDWATTDDAKIRGHWSVAPRDNVGIACGDGLLVLDVDGDEGKASLAALEAEHGALPETCRIKTPRGGFHYYFHYTGPSLTNSVSKVGKCIDIRSGGGYVLGPGSVTKDGTYEVDVEAENADAPQWLLDLCSKTRERKNTGQAVPDGSQSVVDAAQDWLTRQDPAVEGAGGDMRTYAVACDLRDLGVSEAQAFEIMAGEWNERCAPPWSVSELRVKAANAYRSAQNEPGAKVCTADDFDFINPETEAVIERAARPRKFLTTQDFTERAIGGPGYVVKGLLSRNSYAVMYGAPGAGKTFTGLDVAFAVAQGREWFGNKVNGGLVLYVPFEGAGGLGKRVRALVDKYGHAPKFRVTENPDYDLCDLKGRQAFARDLAALPEKPVLIVVDTLARCLRGGDENSAKDMGALNDAIGELIENTGACVLLIHHSGKDASRGARGSSALRGAIDTEIKIDANKISATKQRDFDLSKPIEFKLVPVVVGVDEDDDEIISCIVEPVAANERKKWAPRGQTLDAWHSLCNLAPNNEAVTKKEWAAKFTKTVWPTDPPNGGGQRKAFQRAVKTLLGEGWVVETPDGWQRPFDA